MADSTVGCSPICSLSRGSGPAILFIHGIPTSGHLWSCIVEKLCSEFTCIVIDLPGLGRTPPVSDSFRELDTLAASLDDLRIRFRIDKWHVVGHDAGCAVGVHYAHRYQERVECLALLTPSIFPDLKPFFLFQILRKRVVGELLAPIINLVFWKLLMPVALQGNRNRKNLLKEFQGPFSGIWGAWRLMSLLRWGDPADVLASIPTLLPQLSVPTLIFHGSRDPAVPEAFAARATALIPYSEVLILDSGHFLPLNEPEIIAKELVRFFGSPLHAGDTANKFQEALTKSTPGDHSLLAMGHG